MQGQFLFSDNNKRYHTLDYHMRQVFGQKIPKAVIDAGFSCPNKDGTCGIGGCRFCADGSGTFAPQNTLSITAQLKQEQERLMKKHGTIPFIAYFQPNTNTYASVNTLEKFYQEALSFPGVVGLSVGTRPDCIDAEKAMLLGEIAKNTYVTVELGLQTVHDKTAKKFHRGYDYNIFLRAFDLLKQQNVRVCVHLINGLYQETRDDMVQSAKTVGALHPDGVKIHLLHILKGTKAEEDMNAGRIIPMKKDRYIDTVCRQLSVLPPECVIERLTGDGPKEKLLAPLWSRDKISVLAGIDKELAARSTFQGEFFMQENLDETAVL